MIMGSCVAWWIGIILLTKEQLVDLGVGHWNSKKQHLSIKVISWKEKLKIAQQLFSLTSFSEREFDQASWFHNRVEPVPSLQGIESGCQTFSVKLEQSGFKGFNQIYCD